jgi:hypothetical protein
MRTAAQAAPRVWRTPPRVRGAGECEHEPGTIRYLGDAAREGR